MSMYPSDSGVGSRRLELEYGTDERTVFNFFNTVYAWMAVGLAVTATVAFLVSQSPPVMRVLYAGKFMIVALLLGAWAIAWAVQSAAMRISAAAATALFLLYAAVIGAMISYIFLVYPMATIVGAFFMTAGTFGVMSVYGFVTKRDLSGIGSFLVMAAIGLFFASIVNVFLASNALSWFITYAVLAVFVGITAYQTQKLKGLAHDLAHDGALAARVAIIGSLVLYISFINMFMSILRILGSRK
jgi:FtsH-binding integral membrane protein